MKSKTFDKINREKGTALIIAIGLLAVLSILGTVVLTTSTRDMVLSGGVLPSRQTFYTADRAIEYAMNPELLKSIEGEGDKVDLATDTADFAGTTKLHKTIIENTGPGSLISGTITRTTSDLDARFQRPGTEIGAISGAIYHIETIATHNNIVSRIDASVICRWYNLQL
ncbi:MAG: pilus assembly PilX N-terminal domain-containing protein [Trichloromonas sp.]|jgi:hypothetical protein|nr:pilus assembly PilX N-terminal domain-containing protein [Trichloromonas sp.]